MSDTFFLHDSQITWGHCPETTTSLQNWLREFSFRKGGSVALESSTAEGSRRALLVQSVIPKSASALPRIDWSQFREHPFSSYSEAVIVAVWVSPNDGPDIACSFRVSKLEGPVAVKPYSGSGEILRVEAPDEILAPLTLALAFHCVLHGVKPGKNEPLPWWDDIRVIRLGKWQVQADQRVPAPLSLPDNKIWFTQASTKDELLEQIRSNNPNRGGMNTASFVGASWEISQKLEDAEEVVLANRSNQNGVRFQSRQFSKGEVCLMAPGLMDARPRTGGSWLATNPAWRSTVPETLRNGRWAFGGSSKTQTKTEQQIDLTRWWVERALELVGWLGLDQSDVIAESIGERFILDARGNETPPGDIWTDQLAGDYTALRGWLAANEHIEEAIAEELSWQCWQLLGPVDKVQDLLEPHPLVFVVGIRTDFECIIAGPDSAMDDALLNVLNSPRMHANELNFSGVIHCPAAASAKLAYRKWMKGVDSCPELTAPFDFRKEVEDAYRGGKRVFIDLSSTGHLANCVDRTLEDRPHAAIPISRVNAWGPTQLLDAAAELIGLGIQVDVGQLHAMLSWHSEPRTLVVLPDYINTTLPKTVVEESRLILQRAADLHQRHIDEQTRLHQQLLELHSNGLAHLMKALESQ